MIPEDLRRQLPAEVNPTDISRHALLGSAPGPDFGETHLIIHDAALLAFWRASPTAPLEPLVHAADPLPRLESGDFSSTLVLLGPESEHRITVSAAETKAVVAILDALGPVQSTAPSPQIPAPSPQAPASVSPPKDMGALGVKELYGELAQLGVVVQKLYGQKKKRRDVVRWANSVERCAHRAGFLIVNDLAVAAACISCEPVPVGGVSVKEKNKQLVQYAVSERYFAVRSHLAAAGPH